MNTVAVQIPEQLLHEADEMIHCGLFKSASDVVIAALSEFVRHYRPELMDQYAREDIAWAKGLSASGRSTGAKNGAKNPVKKEKR
jgi:Arc/MetJ-type ribon-helix-helix transcriptional regulator